MDTERETEIIREIKDGNYLAFEEIVAVYQNRLMFFIYRVVKDEEDARDLCQDTFFKAYQAIKSFKGQSKFSTWLFQIGYRLSLNFIKKEKRQDESDRMIRNPAVNSSRSSSEPPGKLELDELSLLIGDLMQEVPRKYRAAMHLYFKEEKRYEEIGAIMNIPLNTVKSHILRGKKWLKQRLIEDHQLQLKN